MPKYEFLSYEVVHHESVNSITADTYEEALELAKMGHLGDRIGDIEWQYDMPADTPCWAEIPEQNPAHYPMLVLWEQHQFMLTSPADLSTFWVYLRSNTPAISYGINQFLAALAGKPSSFTLLRDFGALAKATAPAEKI